MAARPTPSELAAAVGRFVPDVLGPGLGVLFCGINPGLWSAAVGHHFARPGNRFWKALHQGGLTPRLLAPDEEDELLALGLGITNLVDRATAGAAELGAAELREGGARLAAKADEDRVLRLSAAMYAEEMGENPLARDPDGYRRRIRMLIARGWTYVYETAGHLQFKMDVGCASNRTAQIQGVYVPPELRGRGVGTVAMAACCELAFERHPNLSLYVNDFNAPAVALYERIGFRREPYDFQTIMLP